MRYPVRRHKGRLPYWMPDDGMIIPRPETFVYDLLCTWGWMTEKRIAHKLGIELQVAERLCERLAGKGRIEVTTDQRGWTPVVPF